MLNQYSSSKEDNRSLFEILDDIKKQQKEWIKKGAEIQNCDMCYKDDKCFWHRSGQEHVEFMRKKMSQKLHCEIDLMGKILCDIHLNLIELNPKITKTKLAREARKTFLEFYPKKTNERGFSVNSFYKTLNNAIKNNERDLDARN